MSFFRDLFEDLRSNPLMLVGAIVLLVALVAVPILLSKPTKAPVASQPPLPDPTTGPSGATGPQNQAIADIKPVTKAGVPFYEQDGKSVKIFERKNPFSSRATPEGTATATSTATGTTGGSGASTGTGTSGTTGTTGGSTGGGASGGSGSGTSYYTYVANVQFGKDGEKLKKQTLEGLRSLPSSKNPIIVFLGVSSDGKTAVFLMSSSATTTGDGKCVPSNDECSFIYMKKDDAQTIEAVSADGNVTTYELKLDSIKAKKISDPTKASSAATKAKARADARRAGKHVRAEVKKKARKRNRELERNRDRLVTVIDKIGF